MTIKAAAATRMRRRGMGRMGYDSSGTWVGGGATDPNQEYVPGPPMTVDPEEAWAATGPMAQNWSYGTNAESYDDETGWSSGLGSYPGGGSDPTPGWTAGASPSSSGGSSASSAGALGYGLDYVYEAAVEAGEKPVTEGTIGGVIIAGIPDLTDVPGVPGKKPGGSTGGGGSPAAPKKHAAGADEMSTGTKVALGLGAAALVAGGVYLVTKRRRNRRSRRAA